MQQGTRQLCGASYVLSCCRQLKSYSTPACSEITLEAPQRPLQQSLQLPGPLCFGIRNSDTTLLSHFNRSSLDSAGALHHPKQHHQLHDPWPIAAAATAPSGIRSPDTATDDFDSTPRAVSLSTTATEVKLQQESFKGFEWLSHWYPVHVVDQLNPSRPHAVELLGKQLVLWRDSQGIWSCFDNACPHRYVGFRGLCH